MKTKDVSIDQILSDVFVESISAGLDPYDNPNSISSQYNITQIKVKLSKQTVDYNTWKITGNVSSKDSEEFPVTNFHTSVFRDKCTGAFVFSSALENSVDAIGKLKTIRINFKVTDENSGKLMLTVTFKN